MHVSTDGGSRPTWGADGRELYFQNGRNEVMRVLLTSDRGAVAANAQMVFVPCASVQRIYVAGQTDWGHDLTADGKRFLFTCESPSVVPSEITVLVNWQSKLPLTAP